ncbi:hypothetical protein KR084_012014 [Drosophila pseudotakahashii]|nr:hypothetical protein KR084_012014 [Drosophila pseudotakahashii]
MECLFISVTISNLLPWLLVVIAVFWSCQLNVLALPKVEPRHETCNNEQRYENQVMCEDKSFGALVPYPDNCSLFLVCDCLYPTVKLCPANLWWDNKTQLCNYPQAVECIYYTIETPEPTDGTTRITQSPTSSTAKITTESTTTTEKITTESTSPNIPDETLSTSSWDPPALPPGISEDYCRNYKDGYLLSYPYDCQAYINCTHGWPVLEYCVKDKLFNELLGICDTPDEVDCDERPLPTTTTQIPLTSTTEWDGVCGPTPEGVEEDYCMPKGNGFYEYPYNCSGYLACRNGCTDLDYCQPDKLFNSWLHICDTPNSVWCDPSPYPTTPGTTGKPTTSSVTTTPSTTPSPSTLPSTTESSTTAEIPITTPGLPSDVDPNVCDGKLDGTIFAYIGNCSEYLLCKNNKVEMGQCPPNTLFNPDWLVCDDPKDVVCLGDRTTTPIPTTKPTTTTEETTTTTTTTTAATTLGPDQLCEGQEMGASFPYTADCSQYYLCLGDGKWALAPCIYNSYYDPTTGQCGPNVSPDACKASQVTTTSTTTETTTTERITTPKPTTQASSTTPKTTTTVSPTTGICGGRNENENIAYPNKCNKYIVCVSPIPIAFFCPDDTFFSSKLQKCIESWEQSDCEGEQSTTTLEPGYTRPPPEPTMCTNSSRDTFPYPDNCQWFIRCVDDYIYMTDVCNCGEYYDPITEKCGADVPSDACRWDYSSTTSTTTEPTTTTAVTRPPPQKGPCDDVDDGALVAYPNDCSKYIKCNRPIAVAYDCDEGDEFSVELEKCVDASLANCSIKTTVNPSVSTTTPNGGDTTSTTSEPTTESSTIPTTDSSTESTTTSPESTTTSTESTTESTTTSTELTTTSTESTTTSTESTTESSTESTKESSTESTTTSTSSTTAKPSGGICDGKTDDSLVPYPRNCSKYIKCQYPIPVGYDCPNGLEFSPTELSCMDPELAGCSPKITTPGLTTLTTETSTITTESTTPKTTTTESTTVSTTPMTTTTESTTVSTTPMTTTTESTTVSTTPKTTTTESTTVSTTPMTTTTESTTASTTPMTTTTESTTASTTPITTTTESTTVSTTTPTPLPTTLDPYTPNICCGRPLGTILAYPNDCSRYVVCDYPIPYAVLCEEGTVFDDRLLACSAVPNERCLYMDY